MSRFKDNINYGQEVLNAARNRVKDIGDNDLKGKEVDVQAAEYLRYRGEGLLLPLTIPSQPMSSLDAVDAVRDTRFSVESLNRRSAVIEQQAGSFITSVKRELNEVQRQVNALSSEVSEQEIRLLGGYDKVHLNTAVRALDMPLAQDDSAWRRDFKTSYEIPVSASMDIVHGSGFTLPVRESVSVPVISATVIDEESDTGDTVIPLYKSPEENIYLKDEIFRYVIVRTDYDSSSRLYKQETSRDEYPYSCVSSCTIQLEMPGSIAVNYLEVEPVAGSTVYISSVSCINESGEEVQLSVSSLSSETSTKLLFSPVYARYLKITFQQYAPIGRSEVRIGDERVEAINTLLTGAGFDLLLPGGSSKIPGRVYDFSFKNIKTGFAAYRNFGVFRSKPVRINTPLSADLSVTVESILPPAERDPYGNILSLPDDRVLYESYIGVTLETADADTVADELIPLPDTYPWQTEFLTPVGTDAKVKLFPDLRWGLSKHRIEYAADRFGTHIVFKTIDPHGFSAGDTVSIVAPESSGVNGSFEIDAVLTPDTFTVPIGEFASPPIYADFVDDYAYYFTDGFVTPVDVYKGADELSICTDYQVSLDYGSTWHSDWPIGGEFEALYRSATAGRFHIRFLSKDPAALYWVKYRVLRNQRLTETGLASLKNGRVLFRGFKEPVHGHMNTVIVFRTNTLYPYVTSVLREYSLKVREAQKMRRFSFLPASRTKRIRTTKRGLNVNRRS